MVETQAAEKAGLVADFADGQLELFESLVRCRSCHPSSSCWRPSKWAVGASPQGLLMPCVSR